MLHTTSPRAAQALRTLRRTLVFLAFAGATALVTQPPQAHADGLSEARQLVTEGRLPQALAKVDALIAANPKDPQYAFLRGVILSAQHKTEEAIQVFTRLTEQYPELPEPYNNLAVLYARQGHDEKARAALDMAIRTNPDYATAYENLGDVDAALARKAYQKSLRLDPSRKDAIEPKLALIDKLLPNPGPAAPQAAKPRP